MEGDSLLSRLGGTLVVIVLVLALSSVIIEPGRAASDAPSTTMYQGLEVGSYLEYTLSTQLIVLWNYTIDNGPVVTRDSLAFREVLFTPALTHEIKITLSVIEMDSAEILTLEAKYQSPSILGHSFSGAFLLTYSPGTGTCTIRNGSLAGQTGRMNLVSADGWSSDYFVISSLDRNITAQGSSVWSPPSICSVMGEQQECRKYDCSYYDSVDGFVRHSRHYDLDSGLLVQASGGGGIADRILFGLMNISYADYRLSLTDTNIDLGFSYSLERAIVTQTALLLLVPVVGLLSYFVWRRKHSSAKDSEVFSPDTDSSESTMSVTFAQRILSGASRYKTPVATVIIIILVLTFVVPMQLDGPAETDQEEYILYVTPEAQVNHAVGEWRAGEFYLHAAPEGMENVVYIRADIHNWGGCPGPLLLSFRISDMALEDFTNLNDTQKESLPVNGVYMYQGDSTSGWCGTAGLGEATYTWYYRFALPYAEETQCTLVASITIFLIIETAE